MLKRINLVPQIPLADRIKKAMPVALGTLLVLICLFLYGWGQLLDSQINRQDVVLQEIDKRINASQRLQEQVTSLKAENSRYKEKYTAILQRTNGLENIDLKKRLFSKILDRISISLPQSVRCSKLIMDKKGGEINGLALIYKDMPLLVRRLKNDPLFSAVELQDLNKTAENAQASFTFTITFNLK